MLAGPPKFKKHLFVCENERDAGDCCAVAGKILREKLKERVKECGLSDRVRVGRSGCLDACSEGPNVLLMPDNVWFRGVTVQDVDSILKEAQNGLA